MWRQWFYHKCSCHILFDIIWASDLPETSKSDIFENRLIYKYVRQHRMQNSGLRNSQKIIFRKCIPWGVKLIESISTLRSIPSLFLYNVRSNMLPRLLRWIIIREWLSNFSIMRDLMLTMLYRDFKHSLLKMLIYFEQLNSGLAKYVAVVKTSMTEMAWEDFLLMILMPKCWPYSTNILSNRFDRYLKLFVLV
jgi:hypothetical protein